jgi:hypothetical protein
LPAPGAETYTAHAITVAAVKFNTVYLPPCMAVALAGFGSASDKRSSLGPTGHTFAFIPNK